jgi:hypothetical protein
MKRSAARDWKNWIFENGSYKLVALFVTLILWVTILGRRDFVEARDMELDFLLPHGVAVSEAGLVKKVSVKVSGSRMALKRFKQTPGSIAIDLTKSSVGPVRVVITSRSVDTPPGVRVNSISPDVINLSLVPATIPSQPQELVVPPGQKREAQ